jgi:hypothetical protein
MGVWIQTGKRGEAHRPWTRTLENLHGRANEKRRFPALLQSVLTCLTLAVPEEDEPRKTGTLSPASVPGAPRLPAGR